MIPIRFSALVTAALILTTTAARTEEVSVVIGDTTPAPTKSEPKDGGLNTPFGVDFDPQGDLLIAEYIGGRVFRLPKSGKLEHLAGTGGEGYSGDGAPALEATFNAIHNLAVTPNGDIFLSDHANHVVRRIDAKSGEISTFSGTGKPGFAGDGGPADQAQFNVVMCVTFSPDGGQMIIADLGNRRVRSIDMTSGIVTTLAGNGEKGVPRDGQPALESPLVDPRAAAMDTKGNLYIVERNGNALRVVRPSGQIETVAGTGERGDKDGPALEAQLAEPKHLAIDEAGNVFIADDMSHTIRKYDPAKNTLTTVLGKGEFKLKRPHGVTIRGNDLYVTDSYHHRVLKMPLP